MKPTSFPGLFVVRMRHWSTFTSAPKQRAYFPSKAIAAKEAIAKHSTVVLLPDGATDPSAVVAQAMTIINTLNNKQAGGKDGGKP